MNAGVVVLRLLHIVFGAFWAGAALFMAFVVIPRVQALGPAVAGTIGIAPSANINPEGKYPSMFEPVHGSAPDIAGKGTANPIGQIWSGAMMLDHLGELDASRAIEAAIETVLEDGSALTADMGGNVTTKELGQAVEEVVRAG